MTKEYTAADIILNKMCVSIGKMIDHAVHSLHLNADAFFELFITSGLARRIEKKDIIYITGMSGIELSYIVLERCGMAYSRVTPRHTAGLSREYYAGYALAAIQSETGFTYEELVSIIPLSGMIGIYEDYHSRAVSSLPWQMAGEERQAAIEKIKEGFPDELKKAFDRSVAAADAAKKETHLKEMRLRNGLSQSQLAAASGVPLRTIQQYEQRRKDIRKAGFESIMALSEALHCEPADLMERLT